MTPKHLLACKKQAEARGWVLWVEVMSQSAAAVVRVFSPNSGSAGLVSFCSKNGIEVRFPSPEDGVAAWDALGIGD